jgi:hypothetical protein
MKNKYLLVLSLILTLLTSSAFSQIRHGPPIDSKDPVEKDPDPIVSVTPEAEKNETNQEEQKQFEDKFQKLFVHLKKNWKKCVSTEAPLPASLLDAHAQMNYFATPSKERCDAVQVQCLLDKSNIRRDIKQLKKLSILKDVVLIDKAKKPQMSAAELISSFERLIKKD